MCPGVRGVCMWTVCVQPGQRGRLEPQGGAWARGSLCPRVCAWASPRAVPGSQQLSWGCRAGPALVAPIPLLPGTRYPPFPATLPRLCAATGTRPWVLESPAGRWGPWGLPAQPITSRSRARRGRRGGRSREDAAATSADEPDASPSRPAWSSAPLSPQLEGGVPSRPPASPLWPRLSLGRLSLFPPSTLDLFPSLCPLLTPWSPDWG